MKKHTKWLSLLACAGIMLCLSACGQSTETADASVAETAGTTAAVEEAAGTEASEAGTDETQESSAAETTEAASAEGTADTPTIDAIKEAGVLVLGTSADYPPYEFHTEIDGVDTIVGFDISIAQYFADKLGVELEIVDMPFDSLLIDLGQGGVDVVMAGLTPDETRRKAADFTDIIFTNKQIVLIRKEDADTFKTIEDLQGHKVGAQTGSMPFEVAQETVGADNVIGLGKSQDLVLELKNGKIDAVFTNVMSGTPFVNANDDLMIQDIGLTESDGGNAAAVQKGKTDLVEFFNECIAEIKEEGLLDQYISEAQELADQE